LEQGERRPLEIVAGGDEIPGRRAHRFQRDAARGADHRQAIFEVRDSISPWRFPFVAKSGSQQANSGRYAASGS
jgi:hypothetical protein